MAVWRLPLGDIVRGLKVVWPTIKKGRGLIDALVEWL